MGLAQRPHPSEQPLQRRRAGKRQQRPAGFCPMADQWNRYPAGRRGLPTRQCHLLASHHQRLGRCILDNSVGDRWNQPRGNDHAGGWDIRRIEHPRRPFSSDRWRVRGGCANPAAGDWGRPWRRLVLTCRGHKYISGRRKQRFHSKSDD